MVTGYSYQQLIRGAKKIFWCNLARPMGSDVEQKAAWSVLAGGDCAIGIHANRHGRQWSWSRSLQYFSPIGRIEHGIVSGTDELATAEIDRHTFMGAGFFVGYKVSITQFDQEAAFAIRRVGEAGSGTSSLTG